MSEYVKDMTIFDKEIAYVWSLIPNGAGSNFERNLCYLRVELTDNKETPMGQFWSSKNLIEFNKYKINREKAVNRENFSEIFSYLIKHELVHVATNRFDNINNIVYNGFSILYLNDYDKHKSSNYKHLDEGFTDLLLSKGNFKKKYIYRDYVFLVGMLTEIVGMDIMKMGFFINKGITPIIEKLLWYEIDKVESENLLKDMIGIEKGYEEKRLGERLTGVQRTLVSFYSKKTNIIGSKEKLIEEKNRFMCLLNNSFQNGEQVLKEMCEKDRSYTHRTEEIKALAKTI